jgi:hypothetical protein
VFWSKRQTFHSPSQQSQGSRVVGEGRKGRYGSRGRGHGMTWGLGVRGSGGAGIKKLAMH